MFENNIKVFLDMGCTEDAMVLHMFRFLTKPSLGTVAAALKWNQHPMLGALAIKIIVRYLEQGNMQLVSLLSSICIAFQVQYGILPTADDPCWSAELLVKLRACRHIYAEWLFRMGALKARAEILKYEKWASWGGRGSSSSKAMQILPQRSPPKPPPSPIEIERDHGGAGKAMQATKAPPSGLGPIAAADAVPSAQMMMNPFTTTTTTTIATAATTTTTTSTTKTNTTTSSRSSPFHNGRMTGTRRQDDDDDDDDDEFAFETTATCNVCRKNFEAHCLGEGENDDWDGGGDLTCRRCRNQPICAICRLPVRGLCRTCPECHHGGHFQHLKKWFQSGESFCPTGCGCRCSILKQEFEKDL